MSSYVRELEHIGSMLEANGYGVRIGTMPLDDFRLFIVLPSSEDESEEVFKLKGSDAVHCATQIIIGGKIREALYKQDERIRANLRDTLGASPGVKDLDFFEIEDDGKDFAISIRAEFPIGSLSEDAFADAMDRLNFASSSIEDAIDTYFDKLIQPRT